MTHCDNYRVCGLTIEYEKFTPSNLTSIGLSSHLLAHHRQSINDFILNPDGSGTYIRKPEGWAPYIEQSEQHSASVPDVEEDSAPSSSSYRNVEEDCAMVSPHYPFSEEHSATSSSSSLPSDLLKSSQLENDVDTIEISENIPKENSSYTEDGLELKLNDFIGKIDKRKFNKGQAKRKSYE